ncbi:unnamed protein product [Toxocara canis]|uniref:BZIP domain-containing protein n=1 Tax=Toxocara canis TaxID=6265 RepID=A0A183V2J2_TOXCA|nr:unnamed protein product [Toxocara canis]
MVVPVIVCAARAILLILGALFLVVFDLRVVLRELLARHGCVEGPALFIVELDVCGEASRLIFETPKWRSANFDMNTAKEVDKNNDQKKIDDNNSPDKPDNKRRDSVTGSVLDTGSSSNSSVDSDDLELLDSCCETKATMASSVSLDTSASNANKELNSEHNAMDGYSEDVMQKPRIDENPDQNGKSLNVTAADEGDHANMGRAHRRATKKQFRRERRQKEKEKRSGENQFQQAQERAMRHRLEKASVVQNLLNLRVAENQPVVQKRSQQSVPVSFGDFPEQNHARSQPQSGGFAAFSDMNPSREKELVQILFRCEESLIPSSKVHLSVESNSNCSLVGGSQDGMEMENVLKMVDDSNKVFFSYYCTNSKF